MPVTPTYPGVYIEELPSGIRTITGVATAITAFIGRAKKGPIDDPKLIHSMSDYEREFGGLWEKSTMSYAVQQYFTHGGRDAIIVRVIEGTAARATISLPTDTGTLKLEAASEGKWGENLRVAVDYETKDKDEPSPTLFNLTIQELRKEDGKIIIISTEKFLNLSVVEDNERFVSKILEQQSGLVRVNDLSTDRPQETVTDPPNFNLASNFIAAAADGNDGGDDIGVAEICGVNFQTNKKGLYALEKADLFNILCIPPLKRDTDVIVDPILINAAIYCKNNRAMLIIDPPTSWKDAGTAKTGIDDLRKKIGNDAATNVAVYFPLLKMADPLKKGLTDNFVPCGAVAGIYARTDSQRGVWKAPAGQEASLAGVQKFTCPLTDAENGDLNPQGLNCLRSFPVYGNVVWGARTLAGADALASEWKYISVRRVALYIEESLYRGIQWVVFEPNDEPLWSQIRLNVGAFMNNLFRQGAFQGKSPREAYFVKCDSETTTQNDIDRGIVNILVGFAPLKPAEFVIIKLSQIAGQIQS